MIYLILINCVFKLSFAHLIRIKFLYITKLVLIFLRQCRDKRFLDYVSADFSESVEYVFLFVPADENLVQYSNYCFKIYLKSYSLKCVVCGVKVWSIADYDQNR